MLISFFNSFVKVTGFPAQWFCFRTKVYYEDKTAQSRKIKGKAVIVSNHTSVFDYAVYLFVFFFRTIRCQMAEVLFRKKPLGIFLKMMGGIYVDRDSNDFSFVEKSREILNKNGVVLIFPESRIPKKGESRPLEFKPSAAYIALNADAPVIPVFTNGSYFNKNRARVIIGKPLYLADLTDPSLSDKENLKRATNALREKIIELETLLNEQAKEG
jgi:1-acyl-sn-glycerol-3-phosphate acyltransferase